MDLIGYFKASDIASDGSDDVPLMQGLKLGQSNGVARTKNGVVRAPKSMCPACRDDCV